MFTIVFKDVDLENKDLVVPIGYTGCGKSTMLHALAYGTSNFERKRGEIHIKK